MLGLYPIGDAPLGAVPSDATARTVSITLGNAGGAIANRAGLAVHVFAAPNLGASNATGADGKLVLDVTALGLSGTVYAAVVDPATGEHWCGPVAVA